MPFLHSKDGCAYASLHKRLADTIVFIGSHDPPVGVGAILVQSWVPHAQMVDLSGANAGMEQAAIDTQGLPYSLLGGGLGADALSLFRTVSCKYKFPLQMEDNKLLGPHGRVFLTDRPAYCHDVTALPESVYPLVNEASLCSARGLLLLPIYEGTAATQPSAVLELVQDRPKIALEHWQSAVRSCIARAGLHTPDVPAVHLQEHYLLMETALANQVTPPAPAPVAWGQPPMTLGHAQAQERQQAQAQAQARAQQDADPDDDEGEGFAGAEGGDYRHGMAAPIMPLEELQAQFAVGLKEAAANLGVSATTLKRACRQHGITRWPRRTLNKLQNALEAVNRAGEPVLRHAKVDGALLGAKSAMMLAAAGAQQPAVQTQAQLQLQFQRQMNGGSRAPGVHHSPAVPAMQLAPRPASAGMRSGEHVMQHYAGLQLPMVRGDAGGGGGPSAAPRYGSLAQGPYAATAGEQQPGGGAAPRPQQPAHVDLSGQLAQLAGMLDAVVQQHRQAQQPAANVPAR